MRFFNLIKINFNVTIVIDLLDRTNDLTKRQEKNSIMLYNLIVLALSYQSILSLHSYGIFLSMNRLYEEMFNILLESDRNNPILHERINKLFL